ncbi:hypothetical protein ACTPEO_05620 [Clostridioides difficile]
MMLLSVKTKVKIGVCGNLNKDCKGQRKKLQDLDGSIYKTILAMSIPSQA